MSILDIPGAERLPRVIREDRGRAREHIAYLDWLDRCKRKRRVNRRFRRIVIERARGRCTYCGRRVRDEDFCIDHIRPVRWGGRSVLQNLAAACWECNTGKSDDEGWEPYGTAWLVFVTDDLGYPLIATPRSRAAPAAIRRS